jgi:predicted nuclease of restriction endonuclease-like (RecB) superfamily
MQKAGRTMGEVVLYKDAVLEIKSAILQSRYRAAANANAEHLALKYNIGRYVSLNTRTGKWGTRAIEDISNQLQAELPGLRGFSASSIKNMRVFYEEWASALETNRQLTTGDLSGEAQGIVIRQLPTGELGQDNTLAFLRTGFTHHIEIITKCKDHEERWYYIRRNAAGFWSVDTLKSHIRAKDFSTQGGLPNNFEITIPDKKQVSRAVRAFKDEYLLDYIDIEEEDDEELLDEHVLDRQIVANIKKFIMTFGNGFCYIGNHYRVIVEGEEGFVDLLFFSRDLNCLVAIELKSGKFKPAYLGQLSFYLSALDEFVKKPHENNTIGLLLCKQANKTFVEFAVRDYNKPMGVAVYRTANDIPKEYASRRSLVDGVQDILNEEIVQ